MAGYDSGYVASSFAVVYVGGVDGVVCVDCIVWGVVVGVDVFVGVYSDGVGVVTTHRQQNRHHNTRNHQH